MGRHMAGVERKDRRAEAGSVRRRGRVRWAGEEAAALARVEQAIKPIEVNRRERKDRRRAR
jgi:hypothetical protein